MNRATAPHKLSASFLLVSPFLGVYAAMTTSIEQTLSTEELTILDDFLLARAEESEALMVDEVHGYVTAAVLAGCPLDDEARTAIWGEQAFSDAEEGQKMNGLLLKMEADISHILDSQAHFEPLVIEEEDEDGELIEAYDGWCYGFMASVSNQPKCWEALPKHERELLSPIATLALIDSDEGLDIDEEEYQSWVEMLPGSVSGLFDYFQSQAAE